MTDPIGPSRQIANTSSLDRLLDRLREGDDSAREELIKRVQGRLQQLFECRLRRDRVAQLEGIDEVLNAALFRLYRALAEVHPANVNKLLALAALQVGRELRDLCDKYFGKNHDREPVRPAPQPADNSIPSPIDEIAEEITGTTTNDRWELVHELVPKLSEKHQEIFGLRYYLGLEFEEIGQLLGIPANTANHRYLAVVSRLGVMIDERLRAE
jgi:RNA polymerase sigma factor (sigma-70 family)